MTGNPVKSRFVANFIEKNEASLTANLRISCFGCFFVPLEGREVDRVLGSIGFTWFLSTCSIHNTSKLGCKDIIHQASSSENRSSVITWRYCVTD